MAQFPVFDQSGKEIRKDTFDETIFGDKVLLKTLREVVLAYGRNQHRGTHHAKDRGDVSGSNRKLWKQKGTGRARVGDRRPPHWKGGGVAHGPHPRSYHRPIPSRLRHVALNSALLSKFRDGEVAVVEGLEFAGKPKTKKITNFIDGAAIRGSVLFATGSPNHELVVSTRNLKRTNVREVRDLNAYDVVRHARVIFTPDAIALLREGAVAKKAKREEVSEPKAKAKRKGGKQA